MLWKLAKKLEGYMTLFDKRAECFPKKIDRFEKIKAVSGAYTDLTNALKVINKAIYKRLEAVIISSYSSNKTISGPTLFLPKNKELYEKKITTFNKTRMNKDFPNWTVFFLKTLYQ